MLDDRSAFERAHQVADDFNTLADIHGELLTAQAQQQSLFPVRKKHEAYARCLEQLNLHRFLKSILPTWIALKGKQLWEERAEALKIAAAEAERGHTALETAAARLKQQEETCFQAYMKTGGDDINNLRELIAAQRKEADRRRHAARDYQEICRRFELAGDLDPDAFVRNRESLGGLRESVSEARTKAEEAAYKDGVEHAKHLQTLQDIETEVAQVRNSPSSNLPGEFQRFRADLANALGLDSADLPFAAELVQVRTAESEWRGAIERALGGNRLRILVPSAHLKAALRWVNQRHNRIHVRLLGADPAQSARAEFFADGFTRKLDFRPHPLREALKAFLAAYDLHCVDSPDALEHTPHGLTREGLTSGKRGLFEKKDRQRLDENWCTGFDNRDRLALLARQAADASILEKRASEAVAAARQKLRDVEGQLTLLDNLAALTFEQIDVAGIESDLKRLEERLRALTDPQSDAGRAFRAYEAAKDAVGKNGEALNAALIALTRARDKLDAGLQRINDFTTRAGDGLDPDQSGLARQHLALPSDLQTDAIDDLERELSGALDQKIEQCMEEQRELQSALIRSMEHAKSVDTGALSEAGTDLGDVPAYLSRLRKLTEEALPEKRTRFLEYLNRSSDQGVTQLLSSIKEEVSKIDERIVDLNRGLQSVDFKEGRFLRLELQPVVHESLRSLERAQKLLRSAALRTDDQGESHYKALQHVVQLLREAAEKKHTVGARALLDPRFRVEFHGAEIERVSDRVVDRFKGSQGGSGGEKEIIASYILTASLCYALSPEGGTYPLHSTIVLDEAFSKSSRAVANRIINALREFQLHPIFVTPNKEMRLLRAHTQSVIYVHRVGFRATLASISWTELEARIEEHLEKPA